jgi:hypothetical protein
MGAEITLLGGMILGIDEDGIVRAGSHASFTANTNVLIEVDDTVRSLKHRGSRAGGSARRISALITPGDLVCPASLRKNPDFNVLYIGPRYGQWHEVLAFAGVCAGMTAYTAALVDNLGPLSRNTLRTDHWEFKH